MDNDKIDVLKSDWDADTKAFGDALAEHISNERNRTMSILKPGDQVSLLHSGAPYTVLRYSATKPNLILGRFNITLQYHEFECHPDALFLEETAEENRDRLDGYPRHLPRLASRNA